MRGQFTTEIPPGCNSVNGFGRVNLSQCLNQETLRHTFFVDEPGNTIETGQMRVFRTRVADPEHPLKVTLVWTDAPGLAGAGGLQNQLYLQVRHPDGVVEDGDVTPFPTVINNVQQITVSASTSGPIEIRVRGVLVSQQRPGVPSGPAPRQDFALVVSNAGELVI
jgi:serine protease AprX